MIKTNERTCAQAFVNFLAVFRSYAMPRPRVLATMTDRVLLEKDVNFIARVQVLSTLGFFREWPFYQNHGTTARRSWREAVPWASMQIVEHDAVVEVDIDLCNPDHGVAPALGHLVEVLWPGKTDPFRVRAWLLRRGLSVPLVNG